MTDPVPLFALLVFSTVFMFSFVVVMGYASKWKKKMHELEEEKRSEALEMEARMALAEARVIDSVAYQERTNRDARARVRAAEREASEANNTANTNSDRIKQAEEFNRAATSVLAETLSGISSRVDDVANKVENAFRAHDDRGKLLQDIETKIAGLLNNNQENFTTENTHVDLIVGAEASSDRTRDEISAMYATTDDIDIKHSELIGMIDTARGEIDSQFAKLIDDADSNCVINGKSLQQSYEDISSKISSYLELVVDNNANWAGLESRLGAVENDKANSHKQISDALADLNDYIDRNCTPPSKLKDIGDEVAVASEGCAASKEACERAFDECKSVSGQSEINLSQGGVINVENTGTLSFAGGGLTFCDIDGVCRDLTGR